MLIPDAEKAIKFDQVLYLAMGCGDPASGRDAARLLGLVYLQGHSTRAAAIEVGIKKSTATRRMARALEVLHLSDLMPADLRDKVAARGLKRPATAPQAA